MNTLIEKLREIVGDNAIVSGAQVAERATSVWDTTPISAKAIIKPASTGEVSKVLALCNAEQQNIIIFGGQTGGVDGLKTKPADICLSLERMNRIEQLDTTGRTVTVQAGCILQTVQEAVAAEDLLLAVDLGARGTCQIGGNVATNAGGLEVLRYGMMREQVLGLEVVLADGTVLSSMNRLLKNNTGVDLKQLFIGTEGLMGVITRVVLRLHERMSSVCTALVATGSFSNIPAMLKHADRSLGGTLTRFELMSGSYYDQVTAAGGNRAPLDRQQPWYMVIESTGASEQEDEQRFEAMLAEAFEKGFVSDAVIAQSGLQSTEIWTVRENFEPLLGYQPFFMYDISLPIVNMEAYISTLSETVMQKWPKGFFCTLGHIGDCNLHFFIHPGADEQYSESELHQQADEIVYTPLKEFDGSISAEHGIGLEKKAWLPHSRNETELELMRRLKRTMDPSNILMPGRMFDV